MSYVVGWTLLAVLVAVIAFVLHKFGAPGGSDLRQPQGPSCCSAPPQAPGASSAAKHRRA